MNNVRIEGKEPLPAEDAHRRSLDTEWVVAEEMAYLQKKRAGGRKDRSGSEPPIDPSRLIGISFSGGGIRSASIGLGVLQALVGEGVLGKIDYLSTVSGGGFIGSSLTWFLHRDWDGQKFGVEKDNFPFGEKCKGARTHHRNDLLNFIRQHGNFFDPGFGGLSFTSLVAVSLRGAILSLLVYLPMLFLIQYLFCQANFYPSPADEPAAQVAGSPAQNAESKAGIVGDAAQKKGPEAVLSKPNPVTAFFGNHIFFLIAAAGLGLFVVCCLIYSLATRVSFANPYALRIKFQKWMGLLLTLVVVSALFGSLEPARRELADWAAHTGGAATLFGTVLTLIRLRRGSQKQESQASNKVGFMIPIATAFTIYGILLLGYSLAYKFQEDHLLVLVVSLAALVVGFAVNLNYVSLHRMYRDRLMEAFLPDLASVAKNRWGPAHAADRCSLSAMCGPQASGPYHLMCANVVLIDSQNPKYRGRGGDSFVLSPLFCGSDATGYQSTKTFMSDGMTLPTAMAISGASVIPNAAESGQGISRNRLVSFLMSLLNIRFGYWAPNPGKGIQKRSVPNFWIPGLRSLLGTGYHEHEDFIEITDGDHFETLGLYELVRRKLGVIIVCDGSADKHFTFGYLGCAVERVRVDFGAVIRFSDRDFDLKHLLPGSAPTGSDGGKEHEADRLFNLKEQLAQRGFAIGTIAYHDGTEGTLFYLKSTMTDCLPADLYAYKSANLDFPHQSMADQFFDEGQLEAYRELGYHLAKALLAHDRDSKNPSLQTG